MGQRLKDWIESQGLTQAAFAECMTARDPTVAAGQSEVSRWVNGKSDPTEHQRYVIQAITGIPALDWLPKEVRALVTEPPPPGDEEGCD